MLDIRLGIAALSVLACASGCIDDFDHPDGFGSSGSAVASCRDLCEESASCSASGLDCKEQCEWAVDLTQKAGCQREFEDLLACAKDRGNLCGSSDACSAEGENYTTCVSYYCEDHANDCQSPS